MKRIVLVLLAASLTGCIPDIGYHFPTEAKVVPKKASPSPSPSGIVATGAGNIVAAGGNGAVLISTDGGMDPRPGGTGPRVVSPTRRPDSLPYTELSVPGPVPAGADQWRFRSDAAFTAFLDANHVPAAGRPTVDFATQEVVAAEVAGQACQGTQVVGLVPGNPIKLATAPYDQGCVNAAGPSRLYAFLAIARTDTPIDGVKEYPTP